MVTASNLLSLRLGVCLPVETGISDECPKAKSAESCVLEMKESLAQWNTFARIPLHAAGSNKLRIK